MLEGFCFHLGCRRRLDVRFRRRRLLSLVGLYFVFDKFACVQTVGVRVIRDRYLLPDLYSKLRLKGS